MKNYLSKIKTFAEDNPHFIFMLFASIFTITILVLSLSFPSSAADEPSEGGQSASPTDLTGTSWTIPSGWSASSGFGKFSITGSYSYTWISSGNSYSYEIKNDYTLDNERCNLIIGYDYDGFKFSQKSNCICVYEVLSNGNNAFQTFPNSNAVNITITFTGGTDATNPTLISWLMANGTWTNPPEPEPTPTYTIPIGSYLINERIDTPPMLSPYIYTGRFSYDSKVYTNLVFQYTGIVLIDDSGDITTIYLRSLIDNPWGDCDRNFTLLTEIVTEDEELYNYFINNTQPYEPDVFDVVVYFISGFFKALDKFVIFYNFSLLDFIFVMCGLLAAVWFLKLLAGG